MLVSTIFHTLSIRAPPLSGRTLTSKKQSRKSAPHSNKWTILKPMYNHLFAHIRRVVVNGNYIFSGTWQRDYTFIPNVLIPILSHLVNLETLEIAHLMMAPDLANIIFSCASLRSCDLQWISPYEKELPPAGDSPVYSVVSVTPPINPVCRLHSLDLHLSNYAFDVIGKSLIDSSQHSLRKLVIGEYKSYYIMDYLHELPVLTGLTDLHVRLMQWRIKLDSPLVRFLSRHPTIVNLDITADPVHNRADEIQFPKANFLPNLTSLKGNGSLVGELVPGRHIKDVHSWLCANSLAGALTQTRVGYERLHLSFMGRDSFRAFLVQVMMPKAFFSNLEVLDLNFEDQPDWNLVRSLFLSFLLPVQTADIQGRPGYSSTNS